MHLLLNTEVVQVVFVVGCGLAKEFEDAIPIFIKYMFNLRCHIILDLDLDLDLVFFSDYPFFIWFMSSKLCCIGKYMMEH